MRTLVVASATLAILLVCFSIYQYSQLDPRAAARVDGPRQPGLDTDFPSTDLASDGSGMVAKSAKVGKGERIHLTFYSREGNRARVELSVASWTPVAGATNEFLLIGPEIRLHTQTGNGVRITADRGRLEAPRKASGGLDLKRGELTGHVVLMLDRLTEAERAKLPPERRDSLDPADVVRVDMDEVDFDLEYSKLIVPGEWRLTACDVVMSAAELEIRFNEAENRVEFMRTSGGGRIELLQPSDRLGLPLAGLDAGGRRRMTLMEWVRASIEARLAASPRNHEERAAGPAPAAQPVAFTDEGVPIFNLDGDDEKTTKPPDRYYARFDGNVDVTARQGDADGARLTADTLEIVREFVDLSRPASGQPATAPSGTPSAGASTTTVPTSAKPRVVLTWKDRLRVEPCAADNVACAAEGRARINASGSPVRITSPEGQAVCASLTYDPDGSKAHLAGAADVPVVVQLGRQGTMIGTAVSTERVGDRFEVHVTGPGRLIRDAGTDGAPPSDITIAEPGGPTAWASDRANSSESVIEFTDRLDVTGRVVKHTSIDFSGRLTTKSERVIEKAIFHGQVRFRDGDATFGADVMTATFARTAAAGAGRALDHVLASGHATMTQGDDHLTCREIDVSLTADPTGRAVPRTAVASGDVQARQGRRTIEATDRLVVDFAVVDRSVEPFDLKVAQAKAIAAGADVNSIDWKARRRAYESKPRRQVLAQRLRAFGEVSVVDPSQGLDVAAGEFDCTIVDGSGIDSVTVRGTSDRPATVRLDTLTVTGSRIHVNVTDQSAFVPGAGRLTFLSYKDLDGRQLNKPMPIAVTWGESMAYRGRENRAEFVGRVHATSQSTTTFDCDRLFVEFEDVARKPLPTTAPGMFSIVRTAVDRMAGVTRRSGQGALDRRISKSPTYIQAVGHAVARMETLDPQTAALRSRVHIEGPKLSVNLRADVAKAQIEGPGTLLIEDYRAPVSLAAGTAQPPGGLFATGRRSESSNTLIEWTTLMWYDFSVEQTRFEGKVRLKYFSGTALARLRSGSTPGASGAPRGRATFLDADVLTVDFLDRQPGAQAGSQRRLGRLSADQLRQFQASGNVVLRDESEGLSLTAGRVVFWKDSNLLGIFGSPTRKAVIITQKPGRLPNQVAVEHVYYNLSTGLQEVARPSARGR